MNKRLVLILALIAEIVVLVLMWDKYQDVRQSILDVQGQYQERYAELHREWLQVAGAIVLAALPMPFTIYFLVGTFRKRKK